MSNYIRQGLLSFVVLSVAIAGFNIWADPCNIYRFGSADAARMSRINQGMSMRLSKPWQVFQANATAAVIGSSRGGSISPSHPSWQNKVSFNLSMAGLTLYEMLRTIKHAQAQGPLSDLVIGIEYETFISGDYKTGIGFSEERLAPTTSPGFYRQASQDIFDTLFTGSGITRSLMAVTRRKPIATRYFPDGHWENNSRVWRGEAGYISVGKNLLRLLKTEPATYQDNMATFADILAYCHQQQINTILFISPEHVFFNTLRESVDSQSQWQDFHRELVELNENIAQQHGGSAFPLWGFNLLRGIVDEPLPAGDISKNAWFRDGIHFNPVMGELMMEQMLDTGDLGFPLLSSNVDVYLEELQVLSTEFLQRQAGAVSRYKKKIL